MTCCWTVLLLLWCVLSVLSVGRVNRKNRIKRGDALWRPVLRSVIHFAAKVTVDLVAPTVLEHDHNTLELFLSLFGTNPCYFEYVVPEHLWACRTFQSGRTRHRETDK